MALVRLPPAAALLAAVSLAGGLLAAPGEPPAGPSSAAAAPPRVEELAPGALAFPEDVAPVAGGGAYIADKGHHRVVLAQPGGGWEVVAGSTDMGFAGDGGPATAAHLALPEAVAVDGQGNLYIADTFNSRVRRVDRAGRITTIVGTGDVGDGGPAERAELSLLGSLAVHRDTLYIADTGHHRVRAVDLRRNRIHTVAGVGDAGFSGDGGPAGEARLYRPEFVAVDDDGNLYIADTFNNRIRRVDAATGIIDTVAGNGEKGSSGDGGPAREASLFSPEGMAVDRDGHLYIADMGNDTVRRVDAESGRIDTVAGTGVAGFNGDHRSGRETALNFPLSLEYDRAGHALLIADLFNHRIRRLDLATDRVTTVAGTGEPGGAGDLGPATEAQLHNPEGILLSPSGDLFIADHTSNRVRRVDADSGVITTVAGSGEAGFGGDGGPATEARLFSPSRLALWGDQLYISETSNHVIRAVDLASGRIRSAVGGQVDRFSGPALELRLALPSGVAVYGGDLFVVDSGHHRVLRVSLETGAAETVIGNGKPGIAGDGGPARQAQLALPKAVAVDRLGNLYVSDLGNNRICRLDREAGTATTLVRSGLEGFDRGGSPLVAARSFLFDVAAAGDRSVVIADGGNGRVRLYDPVSETLRTLVGFGAESAGGRQRQRFHQLKRLAVAGASGDLYVTDTGGHRVLRLIAAVPAAGASTDEAAPTTGDEEEARPAGSEPEVAAGADMEVDG